MDENFISIVDYIGKVDNGIAVNLSLKISENIYHLIYWFDRNDNYKMSVDTNFLNDYNISTIYEYKGYKRLAFYIHNFILTEKEKLFEKFIEHQP